MFKVAGIDIGNYGLKAVFGGGTENEMLIPTLVKFDNTIERDGGESLPVKDIMKYLTVSIMSTALSVGYNNVPLLVGECAEGGREMVQGTRKTESDLPIVLALTAMALDATKGLKKDNIVANYAPVFGIPIDYMDVTVKKEFEAKMRGTHVVDILTKGHECKVTLVIEHDAAVPEDAIFVYDEAYDYDGNKTGSEIENQSVFIVGIGQLTTDCGFLQNMKFDSKKSFGEPFGAAVTKDRFMDIMNDKLRNRKPRTHYRIESRTQLDEIISNNYVITELGISIQEDFLATVKEDSYSLVDKLLNKMVARRIFAEKYYAIGGALALYMHHFLNAFEREGYKFEIPQNPAFATARALFKYGISERGFAKYLKQAVE